MYLDDIEIAILMEKEEIILDTDSCYDTINGFSYGLALLSTIPVDPGCHEVGFDTFGSVNGKF